MALRDILSAIIRDADQRIKQAKSDHDAVAAQKQADHKKALDRVHTSVEQLKQQKMHSIREKAQSHARLYRSKLLLQKKASLLDALYELVLHELSTLDAKETEEFLRESLKRIAAIGGTVHPTYAHREVLAKLAGKEFQIGDGVSGVGGFLSTSENEEQDFRYDFIVREILRPLTDIASAAALFS